MTESPLASGWFHAVITLSIVIPAIGRQSEIDDTLVSVLENRPPGCEVLVVHFPSYEDPYEIGDEVRFVQVDNGRRLETNLCRALHLFNASFEQCNGDVVHTLLPGITVGSAWCDSALASFEADRNVGSVSPCVVARGSRQTIQGVSYHVGRGKRIVRSAKKDIIAPLIGTGFFQASSLRFMRGFQTRFGSYADVELGLRLKSAGYTAQKCDSRIHSEQKQKFKPVLGYRGGQLRGELHWQAARAGIASRSQGLLALLGEPMNNGLGAFGATIGRMTAYFSAKSKVYQLPTQGMDQDSRDSKAA